MANTPKAQQPVAMPGADAEEETSAGHVSTGKKDPESSSWNNLFIFFAFFVVWAWWGTCRSCAAIHSTVASSI